MYPTARWSTFPTPSTPSSPASLARLERQHPHPGLLRVHRHQRTGIQLVTHSSQRLEHLLANLARQYANQPPVICSAYWNRRHDSDDWLIGDQFRREFRVVEIAD